MIENYEEQINNLQKQISILNDKLISLSCDIDINIDNLNKFKISLYENIHKIIDEYLSGDEKYEGIYRELVIKVIQKLKMHSGDIVKEVVNNILKVQTDLINRDYKCKVNLLTNCDFEIKNIIKSFSIGMNWQEQKEFDKRLKMCLDDEFIKLVSSNPEKIYGLLSKSDNND